MGLRQGLVGIWIWLLLLMITDLPYLGLQKVRVGEMSLVVTQKLTGEQSLVFPYLVM